MRDWPPCPPIQRGGGRRSRPGVNPFISALTVARCPATFPGVWPQLRDTLSTSRSVGRGTGAFIYLPPFSENSPIFRSFPFAKIQSRQQAFHHTLQITIVSQIKKRGGGALSLCICQVKVDTIKTQVFGGVYFYFTDALHRANTAFSYYSVPAISI